MRLYKRLSIVIACVVILAGISSAHAQSVMLDFKFGAFYPAEVPGGLFPNIALHKSIDRDGVFKWDVGVGAGYYRRSSRELVYVASGLGPSPTAEQIDFTRRMAPLQIKLSIKISLLEMNLPNFPGTRTIAKSGMSKATSLKDFGFVIRPYAVYFKLKSEESNEALARAATRTYNDWGWGCEAGIYVSTVDNLAATISVLYNRAKIAREGTTEAEDETPGLPSAKEVKLHGYAFMLSLGWGF